MCCRYWVVHVAQGTPFGCPVRYRAPREAAGLLGARGCDICGSAAMVVPPLMGVPPLE
ncbi:hypothetical protein GCM10023080_058400 [Streptomyces pseudoechinosporeus]